MITVKTKCLPIYLDDGISVIRSLEQDIASSEGSMPIMDVEAMVKKALLAIQGQAASTPPGSVSESAFNRHLKPLVGDSWKDIKKTLQHAKDGNIHRKPLEKIFCKDCGEKGHYKGDTK